MTENQKLREALRIFVGCAITVDRSIDDRGHTWCEAYLDQALPIARQALALPTADHIPDAGEKVADHLPNTGKMIETAAPVGEREAFEDLIEEFEAAAIDKHDCRNPEYEFEHRAYDTACQRYDTARSALSAGDAVDAQRYRYHRAVGGQSWSEVSDPRNPKRVTGALYDVATDAAMRKGQL